MSAGHAPGPLRLVIVRHGESQWNRARLWQGQGGTGLTDRGQRQADTTAAHLMARYRDIRLLAHSDQQRVRETITPFRSALRCPIVVDPRLRELDVGRWTGRTHDEVRALDPEGYQAFMARRDVRAGGGERIGDLRARVTQSLRDVLSWLPRLCGGTAVIVTHGWSMRAGVAALTGVPHGQEWELDSVGNCGLVELTAHAGRDGACEVVAYDERGHLAEWDEPTGRPGAAVEPSTA